MARQPEGKNVAGYKRFLEDRGAFVVKIHGGDNPYQTPGISDLIAVYRGVPLALEAKLPGERLRPKQELFLRRWNEAGGIGEVVQNQAQIAAVLERVDQGKGDV